MHQLRKGETGEITFWPAAFGLAVFVAVFLLDQGSKFLAERSGAEFILNTGFALGFFSSPLVVFWAEFLALLALIWFGSLVYREGNRDETLIGSALVVGGGLGNLFDRVIRGGVLDFINFGIGPRFNLADCFILLGALILMVSGRKCKVSGTGD